MSNPANTEMKVKLLLQRVLITPAAQLALCGADVMDAMLRHMCGDWGTVDAVDWEANDKALVEGARILSAYVDRFGEKFWIITEADRTATTILLPQDY